MAFWLQCFPRGGERLEMVQTGYFPRHYWAIQIASVRIWEAGFRLWENASVCSGLWVGMPYDSIIVCALIIL